MNKVEETHKNDVINFNNKFSKYTKNYTLLVIYHIKNIIGVPKRFKTFFILSTQDD